MVRFKWHALGNLPQANKPANISPCIVPSTAIGAKVIDEAREARGRLPFELAFAFQ